MAAHPYGVHGPPKGLWSIYHIEIGVGYGMWRQFFGSFGPYGCRLRARQDQVESLGEDDRRKARDHRPGLRGAPSTQAQGVHVTIWYIPGP